MQHAAAIGWCRPLPNLGALGRSCTRLISVLVENPMHSADDALQPILAFAVSAFVLLLLRLLPRYGEAQEDAISALQEGGIYTADTAQRPASLGIANDLAVRVLVRGGVLRVTNDGRVFLSRDGLTVARKRQRRRARQFWLVSVTVPVLLFFLVQLYS